MAFLQHNDQARAVMAQPRPATGAAETQSGVPFDLDGLWASEFGSRFEIVLRIFGCVSACVLLWLYNPSILWPAWAVTYIGSLALAYFGLDTGRVQMAPAARLALYLLLFVSFTSLPAYLVAFGDTTLVFCGVAGLVALALWTLFRVDPPRIVLPMDIGRGWLVCAIAAWSGASMADTFPAQAAIVIISAVLAGYYTMALIRKRAVAREREAQALRAQEAQKMEAVGRLSGGIAHDFNNILTALQGSLELYKEVPEGPERDALVQDAREASDRASGLVAQLLGFAGRARLRAQPLETADILEDVAARSREVLPPSVSFEVRGGPEGLAVLADREGLLSALLHLVRNAGDAVGRGGEIIVSCEMCEGSAMVGGDVPAQDTRDAHVRFTVADDGPGMSAGTLRHALEPFFTTKPVGQGSGLGLPMAKGFSEQSGGGLRIVSTPAGTQVSMHLPIAPRP